MIKAVIFDYGGVIAGNVNAFFVKDKNGNKMQGDPSMKLVADDLGVSYNDVIKSIKPYVPGIQRGDFAEGDFWKKFCEENKVKLPPDYQTIGARNFGSIYQENPEINGLIIYLKKAGLTVGLLSNTSNSQSGYLEKEGRYTKFEPLVLSCRVHSRKPDKKIYQIVLNELQKKYIKPSESIYIDDIATYLEPAKELGMETINFRNGEHSVDYLKKELNKLGVDV